MSELFLDTETEDWMYRDIAREIRASGLTLTEAESVFWNEVYPGLWSNLASTAGVWNGFDVEWLQGYLKVKPMRRPRRHFFPGIANDMRTHWTHVVSAYQDGQERAGS